MSNELMEKMAEVAPQHYAFLLKTASEIKESPFKGEILEELDHLMKLALDWGSIGRGAGSFGKAVGKGALGIGAAAGGAALGGIALALAGDMYDAAKRGITKGRDYKSMMEANPHLTKMPAKEVQKAFSVLHRLNPEFAGDPTVAGAWVGRQVNLTSMQPDEYANMQSLKPLVDARKNMVDSRKLSPFKMDKEPKKGPPGQAGPAGPSGPMGPAGPMGPPGADITMYPAPSGGWRTTP